MLMVFITLSFRSWEILVSFSGWKAKADSRYVVWPMLRIEMVAGLGLKCSNFFYCATLPLSGACHPHFSLTLTDSHENATKKHLTGIDALQGSLWQAHCPLISAQHHHWENALFVLLLFCKVPYSRDFVSCSNHHYFVSASHQKDAAALGAARGLEAGT